MKKGSGVRRRKRKSAQRMWHEISGGVNREGSAERKSAWRNVASALDGWPVIK